MEEQHHLLADSRWRLSEAVTIGKSWGEGFVVKSTPHKTYLTIHPGQWRILQRFREGATAAEILPRMIGDRECPPLRSFYELILKAVRANILVGDRPLPPPVAALDWKVGLPAQPAQVLAVLLILAGFAALLTRGLQVPETPLDFALGIAALLPGLTLGNLLAACVLRGSGCEVYLPRFHWKTLLPHFGVSLEDGPMGGRECEVASALVRIAPFFALAGVASFWYPPLTYAGFLGILIQTDPLLRSPALDLLQARYRRIKLSTAQDFLFVQNRLYWIFLRSRLRAADRRYLAIYAAYTLGWLALVFFVHMRLFKVSAADWLCLVMDRDYLQWVALAALVGVGALLLGSASLALWIVLRNLAHLLIRNVPRGWTQRAVPAEELSAQGVIDLLERSPLFHPLPPEARSEVARRALALDIKARRVIIREGEHGDCLYVIHSGRVEVVHELLSGRYERVAELGPGDAFGEVALLQNTPRTRTVRSISATTLLALRREDFQELLVSRLGVNRIEEILQKRAFLARLPLCEGWHPQAVERFAAVANLQSVPQGRTVVRQGLDNHFFHVIYEGHFEVRIDGRRKAILETGDFFGEISLLQSTVPNADVIATSEGRLLTIHRSDFLRFLASDFLIGLQFETIGSRRLHRPIFPLDGRALDAC